MVFSLSAHIESVHAAKDYVNMHAPLCRYASSMLCRVPDSAFNQVEACNSMPGAGGGSLNLLCHMRELYAAALPLAQ